MLRIGSIFIALASWTVSTIAFIPLLPAEAWAEGCSQWDVSGHWDITQSNGFGVRMDLTQDYPTGEIYGNASYFSRGSGTIVGTVHGWIRGDVIELDTSWGGIYTGSVALHRDRIEGYTHAKNSPQIHVGWQGHWGHGRFINCRDVAPPPASAEAANPPSHPEKPVKKLGKRLPGTSTTSDIPQHQVAKANDDVDFYKGPGGEFGAYQCGPINCFMKKDETAKVLWSQNGWYKVQTNKVPDGSGWVAADHLTVTTH